MTGEGCSCLLSTSHRFLLCLLIYRSISNVLSLVPVPQEYPVNDTVEVGIYHSRCPDGYFQVRDSNSYHRKATGTPNPTPCKLCSQCRKGEHIISACSSNGDTECGCGDGLKYSQQIAHCIPPEGVDKNWTLADYKRWEEEKNPSPTSQETDISVTTKVSHNAMMSKSQVQETNNGQVEHAVKPDWTDFYILTVSSTAVLFFTLSLVLLFLMAVMKARSWYLYRRLPGSGITLCFRGWLSRILSRHSPGHSDGGHVISVVTHTDQGTTARDGERKEDETVAEQIVMTSPLVETHGNCLHQSEIIDCISSVDAVICCADFHFTFPQKKTYVSSCITSEEDVADTRTKGSPNFILQACHNSVNVVLGQTNHKCCRNRNKLTLTSSDLCPLGQFDSATMEVQDWAYGKPKSLSSLAKDSSETMSLMGEGECQHEQRACIKPEDILNLYTEIATPFQKSPDLKFEGSLRLYLKNGFSGQPSFQQKVKLKYRKKKGCGEGEDVKEALLKVEEMKRKRADGIGFYSSSQECLAQHRPMVEGEQLGLSHRRNGESSPCLYSSPQDVFEGESHCGCDYDNCISSLDRCTDSLSLEGGSSLSCIPVDASEAVSESSVEVVVDVHKGDVNADDDHQLNSSHGSGLLVITSV